MQNDRIFAGELLKTALPILEVFSADAMSQQEVIPFPAVFKSRFPQRKATISPVSI
jgi:hypothetical protein